MTSKLQRIVWATAIVAMFPIANAAQRVDVDRVVACANESDDARRLACYDDAVAAAKKPARAEAAPATPALPATPAAPVAATKPPAPPAVPAPAASSDTDFGVTGSAVARQRQLEQEQQKDESGKVDSLAARVASVSSKPHGELVITLDNGQVWAQKKTERYFAAKPGDQVTINAGMLGSYRMIIGNRSTHVTRVK